MMYRLAGSLRNGLQRPRSGGGSSRSRPVFATAASQSMSGQTRSPFAASSLVQRWLGDPMLRFAGRIRP